MSSLVKNGELVLENKSMYFCNYLTVEKGVALHLFKLESPSPTNALCQVWLKLAGGSKEGDFKRKEDDNVKSLRTDGQTDDG